MFRLKECVALIALTSLTCVSTIEGVPISIDDRSLALPLLEHMRLVTQFACSKPQLRSYKIKDSLPEDQLGLKEMITPYFTVVKRCDESAGCCNEATVCVPDPAKITNKLVTVKLDNLITGKWEKRILRVEEHGSCMCGSKIDKDLWPVKPPAMRLLDP